MNPYFLRLVFVLMISIFLKQAYAENNYQVTSTIATTVNSVFLPQNMKWTEGPDSLPKGAEIAVLEGDPTKSGPYTLRIKIPANYRIMPHWHPIIEHITVISGSISLGMGDTFDAEKMTTLPTGTFAYMPAKMHHFAATKEASILQLHGVGPWGITYINPNDDPRHQVKVNNKVQG